MAEVQRATALAARVGLRIEYMTSDVCPRYDGNGTVHIYIGGGDAPPARFARTPQTVHPLCYSAPPRCAGRREIAQTVFN